MSFKPDYGLRLMEDGVSANVDQFLYEFPLVSLTVLGHGEFSTTVDRPHEGKAHALSLDFNQKQLEQILVKAPARLAAFIREELSRGEAGPRTFDIESGITFTVRARLGQIQAAQQERFVPLVAQEIM